MNLDGLKKKTSSAKAQHPTLQLDADLKESVEILCDLKQKIEQLEGLKSIHEARLKGAALQYAFKSGQPPATVKAYGDNGASVSLSCTSRYYPIPSTIDTPDGEVENPRLVSLKRVMGDRFNEDLEREVSISVDLNKFPAEYRQEIVDQLIGIAQMYDNDTGIMAKEQYKPKPSFHLARCSAYNADQNHEINKHLPMTVALKAKI